MDKPVIPTSDGKVQGIVRESALGKKYLAFTRIPYAQPPLGPLRFKKPQPLAKWSGVLDASKQTEDLATQYQWLGPRPWRVIGDEDCLYLNVYTNAIGRKRPVMFYLHGGRFVEGTGNSWIFGEDYFVSMDMVLVTVNFRLGPLGFLNLGHEIASGNQGLRDILFALKWVQRNIEAFGGDPDNVTIFGSSSGSATCHLFSMIPAAKGLFHKAILQSGLVFKYKNLLRDSNFKNGYKVASFFGCNSDDPTEVLEFLRSVPAKKLVSVEKYLSTKWVNLILGQFDFGPVIDGDFCEDPIIPVPLGELLENDANIPIMIGNSLDEALLSFAGLFNDVEHFAFYDDHMDEILENLLMFKNSSEMSKSIEDIKKFHLKGQPITPDTAWNLISLLSQTIINMHRKLVDLRNDHAAASTYVYRFSHIGNQPTCYSLGRGGQQPVKGVAHADEIPYMFYINLAKKAGVFEKCPEEGSVDRLVIERIIRMWFNFAATGNPTPETDDRYITTSWKPSSKEHLHYLDIGEDLILKDDEKSKEWEVYEKIRKNYLGLNSQSSGF